MKEIVKAAPECSVSVVWAFHVDPMCFTSCVSVLRAKTPEMRLVTQHLLFSKEMFLYSHRVDGHVIALALRALCLFNGASGFSRRTSL